MKGNRTQICHIRPLPIPSHNRVVSVSLSFPQSAVRYVTRMAAECGLGHINIREWIEHVRTVHGESGEKVEERNAIMARLLKGLDMDGISAPCAGSSSTVFSVARSNRRIPNRRSTSSLTVSSARRRRST